MGIPVCLQVGLTGPLATSETGRPIHIEQIALDFPELKIVCGHIGYPWHVEMIAYKCKRYPKELVEYMKKHGNYKVLFGSNYPMITPKACLADLDDLALTDEVKECFLARNAKNVFALD